MKLAQPPRLLLALTAALMVNAGHAQVAATRDRFGDAMQYALPAAAIALSLYNGDIEGLKAFGESAALSQGTTEVLKRAANSRRPDGTGRGFPSGHTSIAFVSATYVYERYGLAPAAPMFALAAATGYSRVHTHHHFARDVAAGAVVGTGSAMLLTHPLSPHTAITMAPSADGIVLGFHSSW